MDEIFLAICFLYNAVSPRLLSMLFCLFTPASLHFRTCSLYYRIYLSQLYRGIIRGAFSKLLRASTIHLFLV